MSDDDGVVFSRFGIPSQPALVIINAAGEVQQMFGAVDEELLDELLSDTVG